MLGRFTQTKKPPSLVRTNEKLKKPQSLNVKYGKTSDKHQQNLRSTQQSIWLISCQSCFWQTDEQYDAFRHQAHSTNAVEGCTLGHINMPAHLEGVLVENGSCSEHEFGSLNSANKASNLLEWPG
jgi:hypothetical protein